MALSGFRDFYPVDCEARNAIFSIWRNVAWRYGFVEYDGPPLEPLDLFTKKSGQEIVGQLYNFKDKGDREVALRPEMTPTLARMVTARHKDFKKPLKWFSIPQVYRYERPQKGRGREHYQFNCDIIGETGLEADIELIALVIDTLRAFGLTEKDFVVRLSDRHFWTDFMDTKGVPEDERYAFIQAIDKSEREAKEKTAEKLGPLADEVFAILADAGSAKSERLDTVETGLRHRGLQDYVKRDFTVVRGLAYYTGVVFEVFDRAGENRAIAGGGRYDSLLKNLGGVDLPALGFGMGDMVLADVLAEKGLAPKGEEEAGVYLIIADENYRPQAMGVLTTLRKLGPVRYPFTASKVGKQFQAAEEAGCCYAVLIDSKIADGIVQVKNLKSREQIDTPVDQLIAAFTELEKTARS